MDANREQFLWTEKYRPTKIDDCILPERIKETFKGFVAQGEVPHLLLTGSQGTGKTTVALAMCRELGCDSILINGSLESGIDVLRNKITSFASSVSIAEDAKSKVIILDEADYLNQTSTQPALRGFMEQYAQNCRFVLTCNFENRLLKPLHSRSVKVNFSVEKADRPKLAMQFLKRVKEILKAEKITFDEKVVVQLISKKFPDYRGILNDLQRYSVGGTIDEGILVNARDAALAPLIAALREKDFKKMRQWVVNNIDQDPPAIIRGLYDVLLDEVKQVPQLVILLNEYQYKSAFVVDQEVNLVACLTELMAAVEFKT